MGMLENLGRIKRWVINEGKAQGAQREKGIEIRVRKYLFTQRRSVKPARMLSISLENTVIEKLEWNVNNRIFLSLSEDNPSILKLERCSEEFNPKGSRLLVRNYNGYQLGFTWNFDPKYPFKPAIKGKKTAGCPYEISEGSLIIMTEE